MKRTFTDLHLRIDPKDQKQTMKLAEKAAELSYKLIAVPLQHTTQREDIQTTKRIFSEAGLDFASRADLRPRNQNELLNLLRKYRRKFEILSVLCENKEVARQAAKDRRVDLLNFPLLDYRRRFFDFAEAELASSSVAALEIDIKPLLILDGPPRVRLLTSLRREARIASDYHVPIVLSSGASEPMLLRKPREMALLGSLFGLEGTVALDAVSNKPAELVQRNRQKLSHGFVAPGIRVIKQGEQLEKV